MVEFDFTYWSTKILYDTAGYIVAFITSWFFMKKVFKKEELPSPFLSNEQKIEYYLIVIAGAMFGGVIISTFDGYMIPGRNPEGGLILTKSIAGALFGGILSAELYKYINSIRQPTGILFLPGIVLGLFIGRLGAIATGIRDFTYGTPTTLGWGMDFGDGILRHPTMIYEMILLLIFFIVFLSGIYSQKRKWWIQNGFYVFVMTYFSYRFFVGFIQPYSTFWLGFSTYQIIAIPMLGYGYFHLRRSNS